MKKGIVMEINQRFLTVLTPEGEFLKVKRDKNFLYTLGEEILIPTLENRNWSLPKVFTNRSFGYSAIAAVLILFIVTAFIPKNEAYAYVSIDINPSIELAINKEAEVINIKAFNQEAEDIVGKLDVWKNKSFEVVTENILDLIEEDGYFEENHELVIGTVVLKEKSEKLEEEISQSLNQLKTELVEENINCIELTATKKDREIATEQGTTVGQYVGKKLGKLLEKENSISSESPGKKVTPPVKNTPEKPITQPVDKDWNNGKQLGKEKNNGNNGANKNNGKENSNKPPTDNSKEKNKNGKNNGLGKEKKNNNQGKNNGENNGNNRGGKNGNQDSDKNQKQNSQSENNQENSEEKRMEERAKIGKPFTPIKNSIPKNSPTSENGK